MSRARPPSPVPRIIPTADEGDRFVDMFSQLRHERPRRRELQLLQDVFHIHLLSRRSQGRIGRGHLRIVDLQSPDELDFLGLLAANLVLPEEELNR